MKVLTDKEKKIGQTNKREEDAFRRRERRPIPLSIPLFSWRQPPFLTVYGALCGALWQLEDRTSVEQASREGAESLKFGFGEHGGGVE